MKCVGTCYEEGECTGEVRKVHVSGNGWVVPWTFDYCETAIKVDEGNGFVVKVVDLHREGN